MGDIPFNCPNDYNYVSTTVHSACYIRMVNLICMWAFPILCSLYLISISILTFISKGYKRFNGMKTEDYISEDIILGGATFSSQGVRKDKNNMTVIDL